MALIETLTRWDDYQLVMELMRAGLMPDDVDKWFNQQGGKKWITH